VSVWTARRSSVSLGTARRWRGDSYVTWREDDRVCTTVTAMFDEEADVSAAADVLSAWAARTGGELERVDEGDAASGLVLESCTE